ncbi:MAG: hypothetical protein Fur005_03940 [Roseiflexaceae bacterium]
MACQGIDQIADGGRLIEELGIIKHQHGLIIEGLVELADQACDRLREIGMCGWYGLGGDIVAERLIQRCNQVLEQSQGVFGCDQAAPCSGPTPMARQACKRHGLPCPGRCHNQGEGQFGCQRKLPFDPAAGEQRRMGAWRMKAARLKLKPVQSVELLCNWLF